MDGRGLKDIHPGRGGRGPAPRARLSHLRARRDPDPGGHHHLNMLRMEQQIDDFADHPQALHAPVRLPALLSTGETGRVGAPKRREIGHGALAERALVPVLPGREEFPTPSARSPRPCSNGSTSMGSVWPPRCPCSTRACRCAPGGWHRHGPHARGDRRPDPLGHLTDILGFRGPSVTWTSRSPARATSSRPFSWTPARRPPSDILAGARPARDARLFILDVMAQAIDTP